MTPPNPGPNPSPDLGTAAGRGRAPRVLVVVSLEPWDDVWRRNQHLVSRLLRDDPGLRVLFVEPPRDVSLAAVRGQRVRAGRGLRHGPADRLWLYEPTKWLPRRLDPRFDLRRARRVLRLATRLGDRSPTVWVNDLGGAAFLDVAPGAVLYDITDDWLAARRPAAELVRLRAAESRLLARADVVTVCSPALVAAKGAGRVVALVRNGVDLAAYRRPGPRPAALPAGRTAVYAGTLHADRLDVDLCVATAAALAASPAGGTLVLVGPVLLPEHDKERLVAAGVELAGARPFAEVPAFLTHADVLVVPHRVDAFTDSLDPIKLYEYLAAGRPVVSTPVAGFRDARAALGVRHVGVAQAAELPALVVAVADRMPRAGAGTPSAPVPPGLPTWDVQATAMAAALRRARAAAATRTGARSPRYDGVTPARATP